MFCDACGTSFPPGQRFCGSCGKPIQFAAPTPGVRGRVARHVQTLGILTMVASTFGLLWGGALMNFGMRRAFFWHMPWHPFWFPHSFGTLVFFGALAGFAAGWGLLQRAPWARTLVLVVNTISMIHVPFGTMLGLYTLWVLLPRSAEFEYRHLARPAL